MFQKLVNYPSIEDLGYRYEDKLSYSFKAWHVAVAVLLLFPYICIPVLFGLVAHSKGNTNNYYVQGYTSSWFPGSSLSSGSVVSLDENGNLQRGAGTSIYKNIVQLSTKCPTYLAMDSIFGSAYIVSYVEQSSSAALLQIVNVESANEGTVASQLQTTYFIYSLLTLSPSAGTFIAICQDTSSTTETALVIMGKVDPTTFQISLGTPVQYASTYSLNPQVAQLSDSSFALGYYTYAPNQLATRYGYVNAAGLTITLSSPVMYANNPNSSLYTGIVGLSSWQYLLLYHNSNEADYGQSGSGPLVTMVATLAGDVSDGTATISIGNGTTLSGSALSYYFAATKLDNDTAVVAYVDADSNYGIQCQVVNLYADGSTGEASVVYGPSLLLQSGQTLAAQPNWLMDFDLVTVSDSSDFMVLFSDVGNNGAMTAIMGQLTSTGDLARTSPNYVLNSGNPALASVYSWGALAAGVTTSLSSQTAILTSLTDNNCSAKATTTFSLMEILPAPIGLVIQGGSSSAEVTVAGTAAYVGSSAVVAGMTYYTNTLGQVIASYQYAGRGAGSADGYYYVEDAASNTIVSASSKIGMGIADKAIYLQLQQN